MISVKVVKENSLYKKIELLGHAMYDDYGKDIVCAAVSATVITTVNGILSIDESSIEVIENGKVEIKILKENEIVNKLINNMVNLLTELQKDYKDNIDIRRC